MRTTLSLALATMLATGAAEAQVTSVDLQSGNGDFTQQNLGAAGNTWNWVAGLGWEVLGSTTAQSRQRLLTPVLTATGANVSLALVHTFNFQRSTSTSGECLDGGAVFASINGGAFTQITPIIGTGYTAFVSILSGNPLGGSQAFCGMRGTSVSIFEAYDLAVGSTVQFAFDGAWDIHAAPATANWQLAQVRYGHLVPGPVVPEPSTYALLATGLVGLAVAARRARRRQRTGW